MPPLILMKPLFFFLDIKLFPPSLLFSSYFGVGFFGLLFFFFFLIWLHQPGQVVEGVSVVHKERLFFLEMISAPLLRTRPPPPLEACTVRVLSRYSVPFKVSFLEPSSRPSQSPPDNVPLLLFLLLHGSFFFPCNCCPLFYPKSFTVRPFLIFCLPLVPFYMVTFPPKTTRGISLPIPSR